jgi:hypothetical protein
MSSTTTATTYEIRVDAHLDEHWAPRLGGLGIIRAEDGTSTLTGPVADQSQLHGVLAALRDLGVTILGVSTLPARREGLSVRRLNAMRAVYLLMGLGLALVKWPLLPEAHTMLLGEGVTWALLTAMSLLALLGLRHPAAMLPVLVLETAWKLLWLGAVALPRALDGGLDADVTQVAVNCSLVVVVIAVVPWGFVWRRYLRGAGDPWR